MALTVPLDKHVANFIVTFLQIGTAVFEICFCCLSLGRQCGLRDLGAGSFSAEEIFLQNVVVHNGHGQLAVWLKN